DPKWKSESHLGAFLQPVSIQAAAADEQTDAHATHTFTRSLKPAEQRSGPADLHLAWDARTKNTARDAVQ
ncbi:hypothetical protein M9458_016589, partial [Cirrhinus mrigala]